MPMNLPAVEVGYFADLCAVLVCLCPPSRTAMNHGEDKARARVEKWLLNELKTISGGTP